jgi:hypothetical protein
MDFLLKVNRQIFGILSFDDRFVLGKDLVVEVKCILQWGILIKVAVFRLTTSVRLATIRSTSSILIRPGRLRRETVVALGVPSQCDDSSQKLKKSLICFRG